MPLRNRSCHRGLGAGLNVLEILIAMTNPDKMPRLMLPNTFGEIPVLDIAAHARDQAGTESLHGAKGLSSCSVRQCRIAKPFRLRCSPLQSIDVDRDQALDILVAAVLLAIDASHFATFGAADIDHFLHANPSGNDALDAVRRYDRQISPFLNDRSTTDNDRGVGGSRYCKQ